ncbi:hypothetical protein I7I50_02419 [Histoplasma capsulatum G186AR]|uniref:Uncharacterized protein n=1 Tax=Ajellomyces capsulatus TaxID=5037 RepID=A0A8H8D635_AJECA|nr:hypothetical protein I7I52_00917 [Histoplasma capsulatum]QSS71553.1 hypothetical protein I7I50_02419 [Histoplasma capsulatum G186AR]
MQKNKRKKKRPRKLSRGVCIIAGKQALLGLLLSGCDGWALAMRASCAWSSSVLPSAAQPLRASKAAAGWGPGQNFTLPKSPLRSFPLSGYCEERVSSHPRFQRRILCCCYCCCLGGLVSSVPGLPLSLPHVS